MKKKLAPSINLQPVARKRRSWRLVTLLLVVAAAVCFFGVNEDGVSVSFLPPVESGLESTMLPTEGATGDALTAGLGEGRESSFAESHLPVIQLVPAQNQGDQLLEGQVMSAREIAALATTMEDEPERPGLFMATLGEGLSLLQSLPFFMPAPSEDHKRQAEAVLGHGSDGGPADFAALSSGDGSLEAKNGASAMFSEILADLASGPVVYSENERYTVETDRDGYQIFRSTVAKGDTAGGILNEWLSAAEVINLINAVDKVYSLKSIVVGRPFSIVRKADSQEFVRFCYEPGTESRIIVELQDGVFTAAKEAIEYDTELVRVEGVINSSLFEAVADCGEGPVLAVKLADVFSCEINFINEIRKGDNFQVLVEKLYRDGDFKGYGKLVAAHFTNRNSTYEAYLFADPSGTLRHYNAQGEALQKALLKAPLSFTRISSGYSMNRKHPVLGYSRPHQGVDYAAPTGTPIKAVGDGVITRVGWGNGYGNMVVIKHSNSLQSQYAHMSGFARGIKKGVKVKQGQTIGYVGATGLATGPHLDFRLIQNGKFIDPTKAISPRLDPVDKKRMPEFQRLVAEALAYLEGNTPLAAYTPGSWDK